MKKETKSQVTGVRLPADLRDTLQTMADADGRSLSNQIVKLLRDAVQSAPVAS